MESKLYLILHDIRSAYNVGAIFRTADGSGVDKIFLTGYTPAPAEESKLKITQSDKMIAKTALGAEKNIAWEKYETLEEVIVKLKEEKFFIAALEKTEDAIDLKKFFRWHSYLEMKWKV